MPPVFLLMLPAPPGTGPESHIGLLRLLQHAREAGRSLELESNVLDVSEEGEGRMVQVLLREVQAAPQRVPARG